MVLAVGSSHNRPCQPRHNALNQRSLSGRRAGLRSALLQQAIVLESLALGTTEQGVDSADTRVLAAGERV